MKRFFIPLLFFLVTLLFFYPLLKGQVPFPGDLLVGGYEPYRSYEHLGFPPGGVPNKAQGPDVIREMFPWKSFVVDTLKQGQIPFWNPHNFSGNPLMANFQSAVLYPFNVIFFVLPFLSAWSVLIFLGPFLAGLFTYFFLREIKVSKLPSFFGGIVFAFSSYMVVWQQYGNITHTFLWLPLALLFTERLTKQFTKKDFLFLILTLWMSVLGGYIQGYFYIFVTLLVYYLCKSPFMSFPPLSLSFRPPSLSFRRRPESRKGGYTIKDWIPGPPPGMTKRGVLFLIALIYPILLSLFQFLQTLQLFKASSRGNYTLEQITEALNPVWYTITVLIPDFFGNPGVRNYWYDGTYIEQVSYFGVIPFILALVALLLLKKSLEVRIFGTLFIITFLIATDLFVTRYIYTLPIPILSTTVPTRILGLFQFCGAILAAFGLEYFLQKKYKKQFLIASVIVFSIMACSFLFVVLAPKITTAEWMTHLAVSKRNIILPFLFVSSFISILLFEWSATKSRTWWKSRTSFSTHFVHSKNIFLGVIIIVITIFDLFYFFHKITPFSPKEFVYPQTSVMSYLQQHAGNDRFWGYGSGYMQPNFQTFDKTYSPEGDDPLHVIWYTEFLETSTDGTLPEVLPRPDANIVNGYGNRDLDTNYYRQKALNLLGIKYVVHRDGSLGAEERPDLTTFNKDKYTLVWQESPWQIYENKHVAPRAFLVTDYIVETNKEKVFEIFYRKDFDETRTVILEEEPKLKISNFKFQISNFKSTIESYTPNKVVIKTNSDREALLFLSDTYYPEWKAKVDGNETKVYKANHAFRAVVVPAGEHTVTFYYDAVMFKVGMGLSVLFAGLLLLILNLPHLSFRRRPESK